MTKDVRTQTFVPVLDTNAYADNDVLFVPIEVPGVFEYPGQTVALHSVCIVDGDDQGVDIDLVFFKESVTLGTINAAVSISDADAKKTAGGHVSLSGSGDTTDLVNSQMYTKGAIGIDLTAAQNSTSLWVGGIVRSGTPTFTASGMQISLGFI